MSMRRQMCLFIKTCFANFFKGYKREPIMTDYSQPLQTDDQEETLYKPSSELVILRSSIPHIKIYFKYNIEILIFSIMYIVIIDKYLSNYG